MMLVLQGTASARVLWGCLGPGTWGCACSNTEPGLTRLEKGLESTEHTPGDTGVPAAQRDPGEDQPDQP